MSQDSNQIEDLKTFKEENGESWKWNYWRDELNNSIEESKDYLEEAERIKKIYKGESYRATMQAGDTIQVKPVYNILYSNVETLKPLIFSRLPNPRVRKRNLEKNNVNKLISIILERNIKRVLEETDAQNIIEQARDDYLITKRGLVKVLYEQEIKTTTEEIRTPIVDEQSGFITGEDIQLIDKEELGQKKIFLEYVSYRDIVFSCAEKWEDVDWVAFRHYMTKDELKKRFGRKANTINLDNEVSPNNLKANKEGIFKKAEVWEIWNKETGKICYFCEGYSKGLLKEIDDSYNLQNFFNIPRPLGVDSGFDKVNCPIPDYKYYEEQAKELDKISNRIIAILPYISMGGVYSDSLTTEEAEGFLQAIEKYFPVKMSPDADINKLIKERDLAKLAGVLQALYQERQETIRAIQEITGLSDIVRGQTVAQETATAQELKGNFAVSRLQPMQQEVEFFARDIVRIIAELLAENFDIVELVQAAGLKIFDIDDLTKKFTEELESQQIPPEQFGQAIQAKLKPYINEIKSGQATTLNNMIQAAKILKSDKLRGWAIEVETDSTIRVDQNAEKQAALDFANALSTVSQQFLPLVQAGVISKDAFKSLLSYIMRRFEGSEEVEELLDDQDQQETNPAEEMQQQALQQGMQLKEREIGVKEFKAQSDASYDQRKLDIEEGKAILESDDFSRDMKMRQEQINSKISNSNKQ